MEKIVRVLEQLTMTEREWTNQRGEIMTIKSVELRLGGGIDTFVVEATDRLAERLNKEPLNKEIVYMARCTLSVREWTKDGNTYRSNQIRLNDIHSL